MTASYAAWRDVFVPGASVVLVVNSAPSQLEEIDRTLSALRDTVGFEHVAAIVPASLRPWLIRCGISAARVLPARLHGLDVELGYFLESERAIRWAVQRAPHLVTGTEPHALAYEEVKPDFERWSAPLVAGGRFVAHALPDTGVFVLSVEDLWRRAARAESIEAHNARVRRALDEAHRQWKSGITSAQTAVGPRLAELLAVPPAPAETPAVADARRIAYDRLVAAVRATDGGPALRVFVDPPTAWPRAGWLGGVRPIQRPLQRVVGLKWHGTRLVVRGAVEGPYSYLLMSRPRKLDRGDGVLAEGHVYRGGITIGLVKDGQWACRVDVDEPGAFLAASVAQETGPHQLVVANCLKGTERNTGVVLRHFGWARARG